MPGAKAVLFTVFTGGGADESRISVVRLDKGERRTAMEGVSFGRYVPTGHLVYARSGGLLAAPFDLRRLQITGRQVPILEGVLTSGTGAAQFNISDAGLLSYVAGGSATASRAMVWVDRKGTATQLARVAVMSSSARVSPAGRRIALSSGEQANVDVWIYELGRETLTRLTFDAAADGYPVWTPDGKRVAFRSLRTGASNLWWKAADGSGAEERLTDSPNGQVATGFSSNGELLAYQQNSSSGGPDILILPLIGERKPRPFLQTPFWGGEAQFSPDGRWLAYVSTRRADMKSTYSPIRGREASGRSRREAGGNRSGPGRAASSSIATATRSWPWM